MKSGLLITSLFVSSLCYSQSWMSVMKDAPKRDDAFSKELIVILSSAGQNFSALPHTLETYTYLDTAWNVTNKLPGASEAKLNKSNGATILTETFHFTDPQGMDILLQKIKASLPNDYVYSLDFDGASNTYDYTFEVNPMSKVKHPSYPSYFHMTGDASMVFLFFGRSPAWLISPR